MHFSHHAVAYFVDDVSQNPFNSEVLQSDSEVTTITTDTLSIGEVRTLIETAYAKPFEKPFRTIVVKAQNIGVEAQHALLKVLEEPPATTKFILVLPVGLALLPTVISRLHIITTTEPGTKTANSDEFTQFLAAPIAARLEQIAVMTKDKDLTTQETLARGLTNWLSMESSFPASDRTKLLWCLSSLTMRGAAKKMLWEEIALTLPLPKLKI